MAVVEPPCAYVRVASNPSHGGRFRVYTAVLVRRTLWKFSPGAMRPPTTLRVAPVHDGTKLYTLLKHR